MAYQPLSSLNSNQFPISYGNQAQNMSSTTPTAPNMGISSPAKIPPKITPMGVKAPSPQANAPVKSNTITDPDQSSSMASAGNLSFPGLMGKYVNTALNGSSELNKANADLLNFQKNNATLNSAIQDEPNYSLATQQGRAQVLNNQYSQQLPAYEQAISNAQNLQGQRLGALGTAVNQAAPHWNGYVGLNPLNNQPIGGGETGGSGNLPGLINWGAGLDYAGTSAGIVKNNEVAIGTARSQGENLKSLLQSTPDFNTNPVNLWNTIRQEVQSNVSNPKYPQIDASLKNVLSSYAQVLGQDPTSLLIQGSQAPSLAAFIQNLDDLANRKNSEQRNIGLGGAPAPAPNYGAIQTPTAPAQQPQSFTRKNGTVVHLQPDGTYK